MIELKDAFGKDIQIGSFVMYQSSYYGFIIGKVTKVTFKRDPWNREVQATVGLVVGRHYVEKRSISNLKNLVVIPESMVPGDMIRQLSQY